MCMYISVYMYIQVRASPLRRHHCRAQTSHLGLIRHSTSKTTLAMYCFVEQKSSRHERMARRKLKLLSSEQVWPIITCKAQLTPLLHYCFVVINFAQIAMFVWFKDSARRRVNWCVPFSSPNPLNFVSHKTRSSLSASSSCCRSLELATPLQ